MTEAADRGELRTATEVVGWDHKWPPGIDVLVVDGLPGWSNDHAEVVRHPFPTSTTDVVKMVGESDLTIEHTVPRENRELVALFGAELWLPILVFARDVAANATGDLFAGILLQLTGGKLDLSRVHVRFGRSLSKNGKTVEYFETHGSGREVLEAIRTYCEGRSQDGD